MNDQKHVINLTDSDHQLYPFWKVTQWMCWLRKEAWRNRSVQYSKRKLQWDWNRSLPCDAAASLSRAFNLFTFTVILTCLYWSKRVCIWIPLEGLPGHVGEGTRPLWGSMGVETKTWSTEKHAEGSYRPLGVTQKLNLFHVVKTIGGGEKKIFVIQWFILIKMRLYS